jgi:processive 1,2-diacylglycerol beta-glucosyltransferase
LANDVVGKKLVERMKPEKPEAIIFTHFFAPEVLGREKEKGTLSAYTLTITTDFLPHAFWVNPGTDHYWAMSEEGKGILEGWGIPSEKITPAGIPILLRFQPRGQKREARIKEGLDEDRFTILITSGSFGLGPSAGVLQALREFGNQIQVIAVCGRNEAQRRALEQESYPFRLKLYGFVDHMDELMEASDLIVAKPGGATTCESLAKGVPMVVLEAIPGQEEGNAKLLKDRNASFFLGEPDDIRVILKGILDYPEVLEEKRRSIGKLASPRAAMEIAKFVLEKIGPRE